MKIRTFRSRQLEASKKGDRAVPLRAHFPGDPERQIVAESIEEGLKEALAIKVEHFHPRPEDLLYDMYGIMDEDLSDLVIQISNLLNIEIRNRTEEIDYDTFSVENLVNWILEDYLRGVTS